MKIKLCKENYDKINALLLAVNGKDIEHTIIDVDEIYYAVDLAKQNLRKANITGCNQQGVKLHIMSSFDKMPKCRYIRKVTYVTLYRGKDHWFIINIQRVWLFPSQQGGIVITLTEEQKEQVSELAVKRLCKVV